MTPRTIVALIALGVAWHVDVPLAWAEDDGEVAPAAAVADFVLDAEATIASAEEQELTEALFQPDLTLDNSPAALDLSAESPTGMQLGAIGYDAEGNPGRVHVVVANDTLWDISSTYLGSAWVWPSIWRDNGDIENPHLIYPADRIWITDTEMRRVSKAEADELLAGRPQQPAEIEEPHPPPPVPPGPVYEAPPERPTVRVSRREAADLVTAQQLESASSIVDAVPPRMMLSQGDAVYVGLGANDVAVGDQFTIFRTRDKVRDPDTGELLGYHVDVVGWVQVEETHSETSLARVWRSYSEIQRGDRLMPRQPPSLDVVIQDSPTGVEGKISFFADSRTIMSHVDFVFLNRGSEDGLVIGSPLEVYRRSYTAAETARNVDVAVPSRTVAQMIVVSANLRSAVAFVTNTNVELVIGDEFRPATRERLVARH